MDDGGIVISSDDIDNGLDAAGFLTTSFGVTFDELVDFERINDGDDIVICSANVSNKVNTAGFPVICVVDVDNEVNTASFPCTHCGNTVFSDINDTIGCSIDLLS